VTKLPDVALMAPDAKGNPAPARSVSFNEQLLVLGPPQCGKTTFVRSYVHQHLTTHANGRAFVHDPNLQFKGVCAIYEDVAAYRRAAAAAVAGGKPMHRGAGIGGEWHEVRDLAISIGRRANTADRVRVPIVLAADESSMMLDAGSTHTSQNERRLFSTRRHLGIAPVYNAQTAAALVDVYFAFATRVIMFRQPSTRETAKLEQRLSMPDGALTSLTTLENFRYAEWRPGQGLV
jgi:hypothetical protein